MEILLRILQGLMRFVYFVLNTIIRYVWPYQPNGGRIPPIRHPLLLMNLHQILEKLRTKQITSKEIVKLYIDRIKEVNPHINAIAQERFGSAMEDARFADRLIASSNQHELSRLFHKRPLLGVPFTVKESIGVKGMKHVVGSMKRTTERSAQDGGTVSLLRDAGAIPLLISANPEYCFSIETFSYTNGRCVSTYDSHRTSGGSSGGEGALNGCGASLFGIGSDIAGSIRIPSMFNGIFGHKPTGGITSIAGHFPSSEEALCTRMLQIGPMTRFAGDMNLILRIIAGKNSNQLHLHQNVDIQRIKIFYSYGFSGLNGLFRVPVDSEIEDAISDAVRFFEGMGLRSQIAEINGFENSFEIALSSIARLKVFPYVLNDFRMSKLVETLLAFLRSLFFKTTYTKEALMFELSRRANAFMSSKKLRFYEEKADILRKEIINLLGSNGVLFFPTFNVPTFPSNTSLLTLWSIDYTLLFNVLGLPCTHIPMGFDKQGLPIGFQVIAAPFKDKLCLKIAEELDIGFGGWVPPSEHALNID